MVSTIPLPPTAPMGILRRVNLPGVKLARTDKIDWWHAVPSAILAALIATLIAVGFNPAVGLLLAGVLAVVFYRQRNRAGQITRWIGARLGAASGALVVGIIATFRSKLNLPQLMQQAKQTAVERTSDPVARKTFQDFASQHPHALITFMVISMVVVFLVIATVGGILGAMLMNRWRPQIYAAADHEKKLEQTEKSERSDHD
ncbi:MAG TPA: hypothetical protein VN684_02095 [Terriglobales bacterium]|nr:hypothetical protein [Terriglobales bacterium]